MCGTTPQCKLAKYSQTFCQTTLMCQTILMMNRIWKKKKKKNICFCTLLKGGAHWASKRLFYHCCYFIPDKAQGKSITIGGRLSKIPSQRNSENNPDTVFRETTALLNNIGNCGRRKHFKAFDGKSALKSINLMMIITLFVDQAMQLYLSQWRKRSW